MHWTSYAARTIGHRSRARCAREWRRIRSPARSRAGTSRSSCLAVNSKVRPRRWSWRIPPVDSTSARRRTCSPHFGLRALSGVAVVMYSSDLDEVLSMADRMIVCFEGRTAETRRRSRGRRHVRWRGTLGDRSRAIRPHTGRSGTVGHIARSWRRHARGARRRIRPRPRGDRAVERIVRQFLLVLLRNTAARHTAHHRRARRRRGVPGRSAEHRRRGPAACRSDRDDRGRALRWRIGRGGLRFPLELAAGMAAGAGWAGIAALLRLPVRRARSDQHPDAQLRRTLRRELSRARPVAGADTHVSANDRARRVRATVRRSFRDSGFTWDSWWRCCWPSRRGGFFARRRVDSGFARWAPAPRLPSSAGRVNVDRVVFRAFLASGAIAGLAGGVQVAGVTYELFEGISPGYGYTAIAVALLARLNPLGGDRRRGLLRRPRVRRGGNAARCRCTVRIRIGSRGAGPSRSSRRESRAIPRRRARSTG